MEMSIKQVFPKAKIVTDRFHVMKAVNEELDEIRKRTKFKSKIKGAKWLLLKNKDDLNDAASTIVCVDGRIRL